MKKLFPILSIVTVGLLGYALYQALVVAPTDAMQGEVYRIIYYHVPSAWTAFLLFFINFVASIRYLTRSKASTENAAKWIAIGIGVVGLIAPFLPPVRRLIPAGMEPSAVATTIVLIPALYFLVGKLFPGDRLDVLAVTSAEVGVVFCTIVLITGPLWARPVWGIWWAPGDIRLTSTLVLWRI
jgi:heme exporter protein C